MPAGAMLWRSEMLARPDATAYLDGFIVIFARLAG
jgi:hypothetical protein